MKYAFDKSIFYKNKGNKNERGRGRKLKRLRRG
jgi:hypothetical protein